MLVGIISFFFLSFNIKIKTNILAGWFIQDEDTALLKECSAETEQLSLSVGEESFVHFLIQGIFTGVDFRGNDVPDSSSLQCVGDGLVRVDSKRVGVEPDCVGEEEWILGKAAELLANEGFGDFGNVLAIKEDLAGGSVGHAEKSLDERAFAAAAATDEAEFFAWTDGEGDVAKDWVGSRAAVNWISLLIAEWKEDEISLYILILYG